MSDATARAVLAALPAGAATVEVTGGDALAEALRARLRQPSHGGGEPPAAGVDTTGDAAVLRDLLARVADLATVVLAGPPPPAPVALDLYADLHVRGLTLVGVAPAPADGR